MEFRTELATFLYSKIILLKDDFLPILLIKFCLFLPVDMAQTYRGHSGAHSNKILLTI